MITIRIHPLLQDKCPSLRLGCLSMDVEVAPSASALLALIDQKARQLAQQFEIEELSKQPLIQQTREAYKALGKKPARYRPSAEALLRRVISEKGLYQINNVVDVLNYISIQSGFSIGGYDLERIVGIPELSIGLENEPYEAIARGQLNVGRLPVLRDALGAFGSPTSDSGRTSVQLQTRRFLMVFFDFGRSEQLHFWLDQATEILRQHAGAQNIERMLITT